MTQDIIPAKDALIDELKASIRWRDERLDELKARVQEQAELLGEMTEALDDKRALIERWCEAFEMVQDADGAWDWAPWRMRHNEVFAAHHRLIAQWNAFVGRYNDRVAPTYRNMGRPLAAGPGQVAKVRQLRSGGMSIRKIAWETNLSERTVRTIISKVEGTDRATLARLEKLPPPDREEVIAERRRQRDAAGLPGWINSALATADDLKKRAKGLK
jgi:helix-turn-helix resolvase-like protein